MFLGDFHIHSNFSDGKLSIPQLVDLYGKSGFGAIAITDHLCEEKSLLGQAAHHLQRTLTRANFPIYLEILKSEAQRAWEQYRMVVIPGYEITKNSLVNHRSAHVVALGVSEYLPADGDILDTVRAIRVQGAVSVAAHPVSTRKIEKQTYHLWDRREELASEIDVWEVASGQVLFDEVLHSRLPMIASSDLHAPWQIHSWKTEFSCERHPEAILEAIKNQDISFRYYQEAVASEYRAWVESRSLGDRIRSLPLRNVAMPETV